MKDSPFITSFATLASDMVLSSNRSTTVSKDGITCITSKRVRVPTYSGALAVLALCADYPERVRKGFLYEAPTCAMNHLRDLPLLDASKISENMAFNSKASSGNEAAWDALGKVVHQRLRKNYVRWAHGNISCLTASAPTNDGDL